jgi:CHAD domain-containing protein
LLRLLVTEVGFAQDAALISQHPRSIFMSITPERSQLAFQKMERALLKLSSAQDAESVHGFRTTSRRLQTLLEQIVPKRNRNQKKVLKMLDQIRDRAGKVRDLDVQLAALRSLRVPQEPRRKTQLMHGLIELRAKHERKLRKALSKNAVREIQKRLKRASREVNVEAASDSLKVARAMLAQVVHPKGPVTEDLMHQYRIVVKRARYAAEFAPKTTESEQFIAQLKRLQDAVGNWHDWLTLTQTAAKRIGDINESSLVAALHNVTGGKFRQAVAALSASRMIQNGSRSTTVSPEASPQRSGRFKTKASLGAPLIETAA